jgi:hypothetical protein
MRAFRIAISIAVLFVAKILWFRWVNVKFPQILEKKQ